MRHILVLVALAACGAPRSAPPVPFETALGSPSTMAEKPAKRGYVCPEAERISTPSSSPTPPIAASATVVASTLASSSVPTIPSTPPTPSTPPRLVTMRETDTSIQGRLRPEIIKRILRANFPRIRACYESLLKREPNSRRLVATEFIIGADGHTEWADVRSPGTSLVDEEMLGCMERVLACISYPAPELGRVLVRYPLGFDHSE